MRPNSKAPCFQLKQLISAGNGWGNSTPPPETPANQIKILLPHIDFHRTQKLTNSKRKTIQNRPRIDPEMLKLHSINPFTDKISPEASYLSIPLIHICDSALLVCLQSRRISYEYFVRNSKSTHTHSSPEHFIQ